MSVALNNRKQKESLKNEMVGGVDQIVLGPSLAKLILGISLIIASGVLGYVYGGTSQMSFKVLFIFVFMMSIGAAISIVGADRLILLSYE